MTTPPPRRPGGTSMKKFDYTEVIAYFKSKHRLKTDDDFFNHVISGVAGKNHFIVDILDVLTNGTQDAAVVAGLFQKEYKDQFVVLDMRKDQRLTKSV